MIIAFGFDGGWRAALGTLVGLWLLAVIQLAAEGHLLFFTHVDQGLHAAVTRSRSQYT